ncbi:MAG: hypothetical protein OEL76_14855 [Siculibacillus sp.]|nr:hypothetical protein [Siculibacillus sp.]
MTSRCEALDGAAMRFASRTGGEAERGGAVGVEEGFRAACGGWGAPRGEATAFAARAGAESGEVLSFGVEAIDRRLGAAGGLALGALHEIACDESREAGAVTGVCVALLARLLAERPGRVLWITTAEARREAGRLDGPGLAALGLGPGRLVEVRAERPEEALWAFEEGLSCRGTAAVVAEVPGRAAALDLTATRRLALRARAGGGVLGLLLRVAGPAQTTAAATRWRVSAGASRILGGFAPGLGRPVFRLELEKNRDGRLGSFEVEWSSHDRRFAFLPAHPGAVPAETRDRPAAPAGEGRVLAFERPVRR